MTASALAVLRTDEHISTSAITSYLKCPEQYWHRYINLTAPAHRPGAMAFGSAAHQALAVFYESLQFGAGLELEALQSAFADSWRAELVRDPPVLLDRDEDPDAALDRGVALLAAFHDLAPRPHRVVGVEEPFSIELADPAGELLPARLVGVFDAVVQDLDRNYRILEHKTARRRWSKHRLGADLQLTAYDLAAPLMGLGDAPVTLQVLLSAKEPSLECYQPTRTERDHHDLLTVAAGVLRAINAGAYYPVHDWWCSSCPYAGPCLAG